MRGIRILNLKFKEFPTQREWVEGCQAYYKKNHYEPGNPEDGKWEVCHYPVPHCLGGTETILLLKEHHAVQGVLQSEEYNHPCIWGWEGSYLEGDLLSVFSKWTLAKSRRATAAIYALPAEKRSESTRRGWETRRRNQQRRLTEPPTP